MKRKTFVILMTVLTALLLVCLAALFWSRGGFVDKAQQFSLGQNYLEQSDYEEAVQAFSRVIRADGQSADAYMGRARAYEALSMFEEAAADYLACLSLRPEKVEGYVRYADFLTAQGKKEEAAAILQQGYDETWDEGLYQRLLDLTDYLIEWEDPAFEEMTRRALGKEEGEIWASDLDDIWMLEFYGSDFAVFNQQWEKGKGLFRYVAEAGADGYDYHYIVDDVEYFDYGTIRSIADLKHFRNLTRFKIGWQEISDVTPLAQQERITTAWLMSNRISDLSPLAGTDHLYELHLGDNLLTNDSLAVLAQLEGLQVLWVPGNRLTSLEGLRGVNHFTSLELSCNELSDLSVLSGMTGLKALYLNKNPITNISPLAALQSLEILDLYDTQVENWAPINHLPSSAVRGRPMQ